MAKKRSYLSEVCAVAIGNLVEICTGEEWGERGEEVRREVVTMEGVEEGWERCTPERLYLLLSVSKLCGKVGVVSGCGQNMTV